MNKSIVLFLLLSALYCKAQEKSKFNKIIEPLSEKKVKFYLNKTLKIVQKDCSAFYMINYFDDVNFEFKDSIKIFYNSDKLYIKGNYINGKRNGIYTWYFENGNIQSQGEYTDGYKTGDWKDYYSDGSLKKTINYKDGLAKLNEFYDSKGTQLVVNGNGMYIDDLLLSPISTTLNRVKGEVIDGIQNGPWEMYVKGKKVGTEYFQDKMFIKGISYSPVSGNVEYSNAYYCTIEEYLYFENLSFKSNHFCSYKNGAMICSDYNVYKVLKKEYENSNLKLTNDWFLVMREYDINGKLKANEIYSNADEDTKNKIKDFLDKAFKKDQPNSITDKNYIRFFPLVIKNGRIYFPGDGIIDLLK